MTDLWLEFINEQAEIEAIIQSRPFYSIWWDQGFLQYLEF